MARIAIIVGHAKGGTFCDALGEAYRAGAEAGGHSVDVVATAHMTFDPVLREGLAGVQPLEPDLAAARQVLMAADHLVVIFPLWLGDMPALLKGFLERLLWPEIVAGAQTGHFPKPLKGKSARILVTMRMPAFVYRWWFGAHAVHILKRNILGFVGVQPVRISIVGSIENIGQAGRQAWLDRAAALGRGAR